MSPPQSQACVIYPRGCQMRADAGAHDRRQRGRAPQMRASTRRCILASMRSVLPVATVALALALAASGCGPATCAQSADIEVTVAPNADVSIPAITRLHVML